MNNAAYRPPVCGRVMRFGCMLVLVCSAAGRPAAAQSRIAFRWNGTNSVSWHLYKGDDVELKNRLDFWGCDAGKVSTQDVAPGGYLIRIGAPGYQPLRVSVLSGQVTKVQP